MSQSTTKLTTPQPERRSEAPTSQASTPSHNLGKVVQRVRAGAGRGQQRIHDILSLQGAIGNRATVQLLAARERPGRGDGDGSHIHSAAAAGVRGAGGKLPHLDKLQNLFGGHDLGSVQAYTGPTAAAASRAIGAKAYTVGDKIAFDSPNPSPHIVAHEAAHVVQQRGGVRLKSGVGEVGDSYEQQADAVGQAASRGESVAHMLGGGGGSRGDAGAASSAPSVQRYTEPAKNQFVSENGKLSVFGRGGNNTFYATTEKIEESNQLLKAAGSFFRLTSQQESHQQGQGNGSNEWAADVRNVQVNDNTLYRVLPRWETKAKDEVGIHGHADLSNVPLDKKNTEITESNKGSKFKDRQNPFLWYDCGRSSSAVMGSPVVARQGLYKNMNGQPKNTMTTASPSQMSSEIYTEMLPEFLKTKPDDITEPYEPNRSKNKNNQITYFKKLKTSAQRKEAYFAMSQGLRDEFDEFVGINRSVVPDVGQGYTVATETTVQGFRHTGVNGNPNATFAYHWAGVVAKDGTDTVTLENASDGREFASSNSAWSFEMYGTRKDQTFHERMLANTQHGNKATTMLVRTTPVKERRHDYFDEVKQDSKPNIKKAASMPALIPAPAPNSASNLISNVPNAPPLLPSLPMVRRTQTAQILPSQQPQNNGLQSNSASLISNPQVNPSILQAPQPQSHLGSHWRLQDEIEQRQALSLAQQPQIDPEDYEDFTEDADFDSLGLSAPLANQITLSSASNNSSINSLSNNNNNNNNNVLIAPPPIVLANNNNVLLNNNNNNNNNLLDDLDEELVNGSNNTVIVAPLPNNAPSQQQQQQQQQNNTASSIIVTPPSTPLNKEEQKKPRRALHPRQSSRVSIRGDERLIAAKRADLERDPQIKSIQDPEQRNMAIQTALAKYRAMLKRSSSFVVP